MRMANVVANRRSSYFSGWLVLGFAILTSHVGFGCGIAWTPPTNHFDGVNERGVVSYWETLDKIDLGDDLTIPIIVNFRSDRNSVSPYLGEGWLLALLESSVVQASERTFVMVQPDGGNRYFHRDTAQGNLLRDAGGWIAKLEGDKFIAWAECGWKLEYTRGKLHSITTPKNRTLSFVYTAGRLNQINESDKTVLAVSPDGTSINYNGRELRFELGERPNVEQINTQNLISRMGFALHKVFLDANVRGKYAFAVNQILEPTLTINDARILTWDPATKRVVSDGEWKYKVEFPNKNLTGASLQRQNEAGKKESFFDDKIKGIRSILSSDGSLTVTSYFTTGPLDGKLRQIEKTVNGKTEILEKITYDERGRKVRWARPEGTLESYEFDKDGSYRKTRTRKNGAWTSWSVDSSNRITSALSSSGKITTYAYSGTRVVRTILSSDGSPFITENYEGELLQRREVHGKRIESLEYLPGTAKIAKILSSTGEITQNIYDDSGRLSGQLLNERLLWKRFEKLKGIDSPTIVYFNSEGKPIKAKDAIKNAVVPLQSILEGNANLFAKDLRNE